MQWFEWRVECVALLVNELTWSSWFSVLGLGHGGLLQGTWLSVCSVLLTSVEVGEVFFIYLLS